MERIKKGAIWVYCETQDRQFLPVGLQLIGVARDLAADLVITEPIGEVLSQL